MKKMLGKTLLSLSIASVAACAPAEKSGVSLVDVAQAAARQDDRVSVHELATWLIEGRGDFRLIDVRLPEQFERGSIGDAENIPLARLVTPEVIDTLPTDRKVIVFSNGSENAAKAVVMLRLSGVQAHLVTGGFNAWQTSILNPDIPVAQLDGEEPRITEQRAYACYFVGERSGATDGDAGTAEIFVPPVFEEREALDDLPPPAAEGC